MVGLDHQKEKRNVGGLDLHNGSKRQMIINKGPNLIKDGRVVCSPSLCALIYPFKPLQTKTAVFCLTNTSTTHTHIHTHYMDDKLYNSVNQAGFWLLTGAAVAVCNV